MSEISEKRTPHTNHSSSATRPKIHHTYIALFSLSFLSIFLYKKVPKEKNLDFYILKKFVIIYYTSPLQIHNCSTKFWAYATHHRHTTHAFLAYKSLYPENKSVKYITNTQC